MQNVHIIFDQIATLYCQINILNESLEECV